MLTALIVIVLSSRLAGALGIRHTLFRFAQPLLEVEYSYMNDFGQYANSFNWRMLYWVALSIIFALLTYGLWQRGKEATLRHRIQLLFYHLGRKGKVLMLICFLLFIGSGIYIFYQTNIANEYSTRDSRNDWSQKYELKYKTFAGLPQPVITDVIANVDLFPDGNRYTVSGEYKIKNQTNEPLDKALLFLDQQSQLKAVSIEGAQLKQSDEQFGHYWFEFDQPLLPQETKKMSFEFSSAWSSFNSHAPFNAIVKNGSFMRMSRYFPLFGYSRDMELSNREIRKRRGLSKQEENLLSLEEWGQQRKDNLPYQYEFINFETTVSTNLDQIALAPGNLVREWTKDNRQYFHYKMDRPIPFRFAYASARYNVKKERYKDIDIELYYHSKHDFNIDYMLQAIKNSFDYCLEAFGPYPYSHFRFVEVSQFTSGFAATAYPNTIFTIENWGYIADLRAKEHRMVQELIAHELSHQWWGGQIRPENMEGSIVLTETLAQYTEFMILEKVFDRQEVVNGLNTEMDIYLSRRGFEREIPLHKVDFQPHVSYNKGAKVMYALKALIGEEAVNQALRRLLKGFAYPNTPPSTDDLLTELYKVSSNVHHTLIDDWMKKIIIYDLKIEEVSYELLEDGRYQVNLEIFTKKYEDDGWGKETPMQMNESFEIGIFTQNPNRIKDESSVLYLQKHHFKQEMTQLSIIVDQPPAFVGVDPYILMIDKDRMDNIKKVN